MEVPLEAVYEALTAQTPPNTDCVASDQMLAHWFGAQGKEGDNCGLEMK